MRIVKFLDSLGLSLLFKPLTYIMIGIATISASILYYPSLLPKIITHEDSIWIQQSSYIFYIEIFIGLVCVALGIRTIIQRQKCDLQSFTPTISYQHHEEHDKPSLSRIILHVLGNNRYFRFFWPASICYWIVYSFISSMLIYRSDSLSNLYGVTIPSLDIIPYGPIGYVPTISIYFSDHFGMLIIPTNLIISTAVSGLVGLNVVLSIYAFQNNTKLFSKSNTARNRRTSAILETLGATASLFTACPTCASFFIFNILAGSLAPTIAAFALTYYLMFIALSVPLLCVTLFITSAGIRNMSYGQCRLSSE